MSLRSPPALVARHDGKPLELDRRALLTLGGSAMALSFMGVLSAAARTPTASSVEAPPRFVVTDRRHPQSMAFSRTLARAGSEPLQVTAGLTRLWRDTLLPHWQHALSGAVAGLTTREVWMCLTEQARSHGRPSMIVERPLATDALVSWLIA